MTDTLDSTTVLLYSLSLIFQAVVNALITFYFYRKYTSERIALTKYWLLSFASFTAGSILAFLWITFVSQEPEVPVRLVFSFALLGVGFLSVSLSTIPALPLHDKKYEYGLMLLMFFGFLFSLVSLFTLNFLFLFSILVMNIVAVIVLVGYGFLAYQGKNTRLALVSLMLLLYAINGFLGARNLIGILENSWLTTIISIFLAIGLTAFKREE